MKNLVLKLSSLIDILHTLLVPYSPGCMQRLFAQCLSHLEAERPYIVAHERREHVSISR